LANVLTNKTEKYTTPYNSINVNTKHSKHNKHKLTLIWSYLYCTTLYQETRWHLPGLLVTVNSCLMRTPYRRLVSNSIWRTDGRTVRPNVRLSDGVWHRGAGRLCLCRL